MAKPLSALKPTNWLAGLALGLWGVVMIHAWGSGRLNLLVRGDFQLLVLAAGIVLAALGLLSLARANLTPAGGRPRPELVMLGTGLAVLILPPQPSLSTLAANRSAANLGGPSLSFLSPPQERSLTDWVRLLRQQPDPQLHAGDPVRVSGFVLAVPGQAPEIARLLVRCCLADATPVGLPVSWPAGQPWPKPDSWLEVKGTMGVQPWQGGSRTILLANSVRAIPQPSRPLEP
jgi:uncharacterized repeat protein (TIGR03943 family)